MFINIYLIASALKQDLNYLTFRETLGAPPKSPSAPRGTFHYDSALFIFTYFAHMEGKLSPILPPVHPVNALESSFGCARVWPKHRYAERKGVVGTYVSLFGWYT